MDDFDVLARDFGFRPQGKSSPMKSATVTEENRNNNSKSTSAMSDFDYDAIFKNSASTNNEEAKSKATSVNSPVYDDDIFDGMPGFKSKSVSSSASTRYEENIFASMTTSPPRRNQQRDHFDDILGNPSRAQKVEPTKQNRSKSSSGFNDLIPGFGSGRPVTSNRSSSEPNPKSTVNTKETSNTMHNPFVVLESSSTTANARQSFSIDQQEEIGNVSKFDSPKSRGSSASEVLFADMDPHNGFDKSAPAFKSKDSTQKASFRYSESRSQEMPVNHFQESHRDIPAVPKNHHRSFDQSASAPSYMESNFQMGTSPTSENVQVADDIWLTVSEIPLFTQPTRARPPSRPPPPIPRHILKPERGSLRSNSRKAGNGLSSPNSAKYPQSPRPFQPAATSPLSDAHSAEEMDSNLATAAMKEAMDRAEAKFRHAKEVKEREHAKASRSKESMQDEEREKGKQAVERATREARERAAIEARDRAAIEARLKAERSAVQRAQAEARQRAAVGAKERAERAATEAREKEKATATRAEERAAVERITAEARNRAAVEARERAAASRMTQQKNDNDLDSFFNAGTRPSSAPRPRASSAADSQSQNKRGPEGAHRASTGVVSSNTRKAPVATSIVDDLSSIFGGGPSPTGGQFQEVEGETEERRRARLEREQRTQERAAKALAEKNQRDLQSQRDQEERHRIGGTLDTEIKRWAAGKEGNLRALLSTLQYVLWPECGWQAVSLTDLITGANVKKAYRKATLCIHPDKVQQKGATLQQKYVAEKVFDILKEAWNKFNSEELF